AVRGGQEVEPVAVRRPPGAAVHSRAVHNGNPLRLRSSLTLVRGRNEESPWSVAARSVLHRYPAPVRRVADSMHVVLGIGQDHGLLTAGHFNGEKMHRVAAAVEDFFTIGRPLVDQPASVAELSRIASGARD